MYNNNKKRPVNHDGCSVCVCVHMLSSVVINLFLAIIVICLNTFSHYVYVLR